MAPFHAMRMDDDQKSDLFASLPSTLLRSVVYDFFTRGGGDWLEEINKTQTSNAAQQQQQQQKEQRVSTSTNIKHRLMETLLSIISLQNNLASGDISCMIHSLVTGRICWNHKKVPHYAKSTFVIFFFNASFYRDSNDGDG